MSLQFCSFSSGSSGNCYLVRTETTGILIDAGISAKRIEEGLLKTETKKEQAKALLLTHEHSDHIKSVQTLMKKNPSLVVYGSKGTCRGAGLSLGERVRVVQAGEPFYVGDVEVSPFRLSHDAQEPTGYSLSAENRRIGILTDTGIVGEEIFSGIAEADLLVLESNYDADMLKIGRYPWFLKQRIAGERGHLSNDDAGTVLVKICQQVPKKRQVLLAHLSKENNFPEMAFQTVKNILEDRNLYIGKQLELSTLLRDCVSCVYEV